MSGTLTTSFAPGHAFAATTEFANWYRGSLSAPDGWSNVEQIRQFQEEWFDSVLAGNTGSLTRHVWAQGGSKYQAFAEAPYKDEFDEWLARIVCYAFSLPPTAVYEAGQPRDRGDLAAGRRSTRAWRP